MQTFQFSFGSSRFCCYVLKFILFRLNIFVISFFGSVFFRGEITGRKITCNLRDLPLVTQINITFNLNELTLFILNDDINELPLSTYVNYLYRQALLILQHNPVYFMYINKFIFWRWLRNFNTYR
jgi:hypothetical protein